MRSGIRASPAFSVIVPTFNRPAALERCLLALGHQRYSGPFEVIVVNDGGTLLPEFSPALRALLNLEVLQQPNAGPATARNRGARNARGEFLAFTDDDGEPSDQWLEEMSRTLHTDPAAVVGGHTVNAIPENLYSGASQLLIDFL